MTIGDTKLSLPDKGKQFLISPPASPPVGWEPIEENAPVIDYNLIAAMSRLRLPGDDKNIIIIMLFNIMCDNRGTSDGSSRN